MSKPTGLKIISPSLGQRVALHKARTFIVNNCIVFGIRASDKNPLIAIPKNNIHSGWDFKTEFGATHYKDSYIIETFEEKILNNTEMIKSHTFWWKEKNDDIYSSNDGMIDITEKNSLVNNILVLNDIVKSNDIETILSWIEKVK